MAFFSHTSFCDVMFFAPSPQSMHESRISVSVFIASLLCITFDHMWMLLLLPVKTLPPTILFLPLKLLPPTLFSHHALLRSRMSGALCL